MPDTLLSAQLGSAQLGAAQLGQYLRIGAAPTPAGAGRESSGFWWWLPNELAHMLIVEGLDDAPK